MGNLEQLKQELLDLQDKVEKLHPEAVAAERFLQDLEDEMDEIDMKIESLEDRIWDIENADIGPC